MDVYVVSDCWSYEGATVIGAAADLDGAKDIADRRTGASSAEAVQWREWTVRSEGGWTRKGVSTTGVDWMMYQEIIVTPLAGWPRFPPPTPKPDARTFINLGGKPIATYATDATDVRSSIDMINEYVRAGLAETSRQPIRVGAGSARQWIERVIERAAGPDGWRTAADPLPRGVFARLGGVDVVIDASLPPNVIRAGVMHYVLGTPDGPVAEGTMIAFDEDRLRRLTTEPLTDQPQD